MNVCELCTINIPEGTAYRTKPQQRNGRENSWSIPSGFVVCASCKYAIEDATAEMGAYLKGDEG